MKIVGTTILAAAAATASASVSASHSRIRGGAEAQAETEVDAVEAARLLRVFEKAVQNSYKRATADGKTLFQHVFRTNESNRMGRDLLSDECVAGTESIYDAINPHVEKLFGDDGGCSPDVGMSGLSAAVQINHANCDQETVDAYKTACIENEGKNAKFNLSADCKVKVGFFNVPADINGEAIHVCVSQVCSDEEASQIETQAANNLLLAFLPDLVESFDIPGNLECNVNGVAMVSIEEPQAVIVDETETVGDSNSTMTLVNSTAANSTSAAMGMDATDTSNVTESTNITTANATNTTT